MEAQRPDLSTPPFRLQLLSALLCLRFRLNRETGELRAAMTADRSEAWDLERLSADFRIALDAAAGAEGRGPADAGALAALRERMLSSPVLRNLPSGCDCHLRVERAD